MLPTLPRELDIPVGTVKSRLSAGRSQMKKGLETMDNREKLFAGGTVDVPSAVVMV